VLGATPGMVHNRGMRPYFVSRRRVLQGLAATVPLSILGCAARKPNSLVVGGLPVTCNLTLPVACVAKRTANEAKSGAAPGAGTPAFEYEYSKYNGWPEIKESLMAGRIQAAYMLAPLVMDLADKGIPLKIVSLGHRSGAVIMVRNEAPYQHFRELAGKRVAIPSRFAVDFLFLRRMLAKENMRVEDLEIIEMAPPDMPAALYANAVDAYCTGEPFGAAAQSAGYARPLRMTRDEWPKYICCVLTVREELIAENPTMVQDLVNHVLGAGAWLDQQPKNRETAVQIAAGQKFFNQDPRIIRFVMQNPTDRVTYGDLRMIRTEFEELMRLSLDAGTIKHPIPYEKYVTEQFARNAHPAVIPL
jgi:NitT/TauT family transport system substrate-binding protein